MVYNPLVLFVAIHGYVKGVKEWDDKRKSVLIYLDILTGY